MPLSHDSKPRKRDRRIKCQLTVKGKKPATMSPRQARRRFLQRAFQEAAAATLQLEKTLRGVGIRWRKLEVAVRKQLDGAWYRIDETFMKKFLSDHGVGDVEVKEAA